jgi:hypothetical protein
MMKRPRELAVTCSATDTSTATCAKVAIAAGTVPIIKCNTATSLWGQVAKFAQVLAGPPNREGYEVSVQG